MSETNSERHAAGLCFCGKRPPVTKYRCAECSEIERQRQTAKINDRKAKGLCISCKEPAQLPGIYCAKHGLKNRRKYHRKYPSIKLGRNRLYADQPTKVKAKDPKTEIQTWKRPPWLRFGEAHES